MRNLRSIGLTISVALIVSGCAARAKPYVTAARITLSVSAELQAASDVADSAYRAGFLTPVQVNRVRAILEPVADAALQLNRVLQAWPEQSAAPPELRAVVAQLSEAVRVLLGYLPDAGYRVAILGHLETARAIAEALLAAYGG